MYQFHTFVHVRPPDVVFGDAIKCFGQSVNTLLVQPDRLTTPLTVSFEQACDSLDRLARMFCEPDGSFVWRSTADGEWQVDGVLSDRGGRLLFVELKGKCPSNAFDQLLRAVGWPDNKLMFQLAEQAVFVDEASFRRVAETTEA